MPTVKLDLIQDSYIDYGITKISITRIAYVSDISAATPHSVLITGLSVLPARGSSHPDFALCILQHIVGRGVTSADDGGTEKAQVRYELRYETPDFSNSPNSTVIEMGATTQQVQASKDNAGNDTFVMYKDDPAQANADKQLVEIPVFKAQPFYKITSSQLTRPDAEALAIVGKTDGDKWLCTSLVGVSEDNGHTYRKTVEFLYNIDTWKSEAICKDGTGKPVKNLDKASENGYKQFDMYTHASFAAYGL